MTTVCEVTQVPGITGEMKVTGLNLGGKITVVAIDNLTWTPLPATPLSLRNAIAIQNKSGQQVKLNYDNTTVGYVGVYLENNAERFYDIGQSVIIYAKSQTSACTLVVEELS